MTEIGETSVKMVQELIDSMDDYPNNINWIRNITVNLYEKDIEAFREAIKLCKAEGII
jgi:hypothetical protein